MVEVVAGSITGTKQFVWNDFKRREERDGSGSLTKRFFASGQDVSGTKYFYSKDHLGSVHELTDSSGNDLQITAFDAFGRQTPILELARADFNYAGSYLHARSHLILTLNRQYNPQLGCWLSRDSFVSTNPYTYVNNNVVNLIDSSGLAPGDPFNSATEAARDVLRYINPTSIAENVEYAGVIYACGEYFYASKPIRGTKAGSDTGTPPKKHGVVWVGDYHTHADYTDAAGKRTTRELDRSGAEYFSDADEKDIARRRRTINPGYIGWLATPSNAFWEDTPAGGLYKIGQL